MTEIDHVVDIGSNEEGSLSLAKRRPRRENRRLPKRYQNEPPPAFEHATTLPPAQTLHPLVPPSEAPSQAKTDRLRIFKSPINDFGLFRKYLSMTYPTHDPDAETQDLMPSKAEINPDKPDIISASLFAPYPNQNAFLLGEWYWNNGVQKTQEDFLKLISIVSSDSFNPVDLQNISWRSLNKRLGETVESEDNLWIDEPDAGWTETIITLPIPFHRKTLNPGILPYTFPPFRHRSIVSVLKEKMGNQHDFQHFHLEPFELRWRRRDMPKKTSTRVHGELYASPAFLEAHEEIQRAAGEPACSLPRVLIGLMFGSDSTHLAQFGTAALWPCYMYFGNESKYRRCKPTCNLCNHVAYFQKVYFTEGSSVGLQLAFTNY